MEKYPGWKQAEQEILTRVNLEGYGILISLEDLHRYMKMKEPTQIDEYKKYQFEWLGNVENLKESLLEDHNICLMNSKGDGYIVCTPDDQVNKAYSKFIKKARASLRKAANTLIHVEQDLLSAEGNKTRLNNLAKVAFIGQAMNKRKVENTMKIKAIA